MIVAHDAYFYWTHRAMHHPRLFRFFHHTHHRSHTPTPWAAYAFAWPEAVVQAVFLPLFLLVVPAHAVVILAFVTHMIVRNVMGHAGVELHLRGWTGSRWLNWMSTTTHHDLHHATSRWNYGLYFTCWDRAMGTEHPDYVRAFDRATCKTTEARDVAAA
jgi:sterol desaturase/sphingolipid hydroxylase (fatty acid hydroxylase superfamily)